MQHLDTPNLIGLMPHGVMLHFGSFFLMIISSVNKVFHHLFDKIVGRLVLKIQLLYIVLLICDVITNKHNSRAGVAELVLEEGFC